MTRPPLGLSLLVVTAAIFARRPDMLTNPQFWAEDGWFFQRAYAEGLRSLWESYAGYQHALPRLVGLMAANLEPRIAPALFVTFALALTLYVAARTQSARCPLGPSPLLAIAVALVPDAFEVLLVMANIQWVLAAGLVLLLISDDAQRPRQYAHDLIAAVAMGLTGPFSVILAPLFLVRLWQRRSRSSVAVATTVCLCAAIQVYCIVGSGLPTENTPIVTTALIAAPGFRVAGSLLVGAFGAHHVSTLTGAALTLATGAGIFMLCRVPSRTRAMRLMIALSIVGLLLSSLYRCRYVASDLMTVGFGARYFFPLQLLVLWILVDVSRQGATVAARAAAVLCLWIATVNLPRYREAALPDLHWADYADRIRAGEAIVVPINPDGWTMTLPERHGALPRHMPAQFRSKKP